MEKKQKVSSEVSLSQKKVLSIGDPVQEAKPVAKPTAKPAVASAAKSIVKPTTKPAVEPKSEPESKQKIKVNMPTLQELLESGAHFGHKTSRWNPKMKKFIFDTRAGIHILDLTQTLGLLKDAVEFLADVSKTGNVLLVGTKGQAATLIKMAGIDHGSFYISRRWPGGLLTNFKNIRRSVKRLMQIEEDLAAMTGYETKKERLVMERDRDRLLRLYEGIRFMEQKPAAMVIIDTRIEKNAIREAKKLGVKVVGLIDTNCDPTLVDYPIPANDDAIRSIELFVNVLVQGFSNSSTSADLIDRRNDYLTGLSKTRKLAELEAERLKNEKDLEIRRLKAMKEGKTLGGDLADKKVVRIVRKADVLKSEEIAAGKEAVVSKKPAAQKVEEKPTSSPKKVTEKKVVRVVMAKKTKDSVAKKTVKAAAAKKKKSAVTKKAKSGVSQKAVSKSKSRVSKKAAKKRTVSKRKSGNSVAKEKDGDKSRGKTKVVRKTVKAKKAAKRVDARKSSEKSTKK